MAETGKALEKPPATDHHHETGLVHSSDDEKVPSLHKHDQEHQDNKLVPEIEELNDVYNPNVYARGIFLNLLPTDTKRSTARSDPFPVDPNAPEETHQLTIRALVVGGMLGAIGK